MRDEEFLFYSSGILTARVVFREEGIRQTEYSLSTGSPSPEETIPEAAFRIPAVYRLWRSELWTARWDGEKVSSGEFLYERHLPIPSAKPGEGYVYARIRSGDPVDVIVHRGRPVGFLVSGRNDSFAVVKDGFQALAGLDRWNDGSVSPASHGIEDLGTFMVPMSDGTRLATDVALPSPREAGRVPTILVRTCYGRNLNRDTWLKYAKRGYAVVIQDVRGREDSEGEWIPFANETGDGNDTLDWIASRDWSDGSVGMIGGSYLGFVQWAAAASGNPHLKAMVSQVTGGTPFVDLARKGGAFGSGMLAWCFMVAGRRMDASAAVRDDWADLLSHRPIKEIPERALGRGIPFYDEWLAHEDEDDFWRRCDWSLRADRIDVPTLYVSGWFDDDGMGTAQAWAMNRRNRRSNQKMILGPWLHKTNSTRFPHGLELGKNALMYDLDRRYVRWFDRFLKGEDNGADRERSVEYYMLGRNEWRESSRWPPEGFSERRLYLRSATSARSAGGDGFLSYERQPRPTNSEYIFDPARPFPCLIDVSENEAAVPADYAAEESREDILIYTSETMRKELAIAGEIKAEIYASSSCRDTDWVVRLTDLGPDGRSIKLSEGLLRARYRRSFGEPEPLEPGRAEKFEIPMTSVAHTFLPGHCLRVQVTSGAGNLFFPNSNTGGRESEAVALIRAVQNVYHGGGFDSCLVLPILP